MDPMNKSTLLLAVYITFLVIVVVLGQYFYLYTEQSLLQYDALHYQTIKNEGYFGIEVAFFPLFPMLWCLLDLSPLGISLFNAIAYFVSACLLFRHFRFTEREKLLCLLTPGLVFFLVPYTEALFFAAATILLIGVSKQKIWLVAIGLLLCSICRPSFTVLLPALLVMELFSSDYSGKWKRMLIYLVAVMIGGGLVGIIQYVYTGRWFEYFNIQSVWDNELRIPVLPLRSWGAQEVIMLDGAALLIGGISGVILLTAVLKRKASEIPDVLKLSLAYLGGMSLVVLLFRGGSLFSLNRFLFCSPFFFIVIGAFWRSRLCISGKTILFLFFLLLCYWLLFASYVHIQTFLKYAALSLGCLLLFCLKHRNDFVRNRSFYLLSVCLFCIQLIFLFKYLDGDWVG